MHSYEIAFTKNIDETYQITVRDYDHAINEVNIKRIRIFKKYEEALKFFEEMSKEWFKHE